MQYLLFQIDEYTLALPLEYVKRVIQATAINDTLLGSKETLGIADIHGEAVPVINTRKTLNIKNKEIEISDQFILCEIDSRMFALCVDNTLEVINCKPEEISKEQEGNAVSEIISSHIKRADKFIYIYNPIIFKQSKVC